MSRFAIIVAGGSGNRMGAGIPKQFLNLNGLPILMHTIRVFASLKNPPHIILVLPSNEQKTWENLCKQHSFTVSHTIAKGGKTRFQSVKNGLNTITSEGLVAIHDGVRPLVSSGLIEKCFSEAKQFGNAIPAIKPVETVRLGQENTSKQINRDECWLVQTPQVFTVNSIKNHYQQPWKEYFTDDASVAENNGEAIRIVEGEKENIKITTPADMAIADAIMQLRKM